MAGGVAFFFALMVLQATMCFWTTESLELMNILTYGGVETASYPLPIYHRLFRRFFTYVVPLACISYFPIVAVLGVDDPLGTSRVVPDGGAAGRIRFSRDCVGGMASWRSALHVDGQLSAVSRPRTLTSNLWATTIGYDGSPVPRQCEIERSEQR